MKSLTYDPGNGVEFWEAIHKLPGYPSNEIMPIKVMLFELDALFRTTEVLKSVGAQQDKPLVLVMDETPMLREGEGLKGLILSTLKNDGWHVQVAMMPRRRKRASPHGYASHQ